MEIIKIIDESLINLRLDKALSILKEQFSRSKIQEYIDNELILVNGKIEKSSYKIKLNDEIIINDIPQTEYDLIPDTLNGESVYEISLQNRISSKQAYFGDECIFYYTRDGRVIMRSTNRNIRDISLPQEIIFVKKE